jgi:CRISPR-associated endonuclease Csn1
MNKRVLGLDPGVTSVGWVLIEENKKGEAVKLIDGGSRIFKPIYEPQFLKLKNKSRTEKRQTRRQRDRRKRRMSKVENFLFKHGLLSKKNDQYHEENKSIQTELGNPYKLRRDALYQLLENDQLSYIILHLFRRRGFYSALKAKSASEKKKDAAAQAIMEKVRSSDCATLGEYFWRELRTNPKARVRGGESDFSILGSEKMLRDNLYDELELILNKQIEFGNTSLLIRDDKTNNEIREELLRLFRFQRPLKPQKRRSFCSLETKKAKFKDKKTNKEIVKNIGLKTAHKLTVYSQEFIIRQSINNLIVEEMDHDTGEVFFVDIDLEMKEKFFQKAWTQKELSFSAIRKELKVSPESKINLEFGNKKGIAGNQLYTIFKDNELKKWFNSLTYDEKSDLMTDIHMIKGAEYLGLRKVLIKKWNLSDEMIDILVGELDKALKPEYTSVSKKAIEKLLPELRKGKKYSEAVDSIYQKTNSINQKGEVLDLLPPFAPITNPIVNKSVTEVRKLVNDIIKKHGKITEIRIELARDLGLSAKGLSDLRSLQRKQERKNTEAKNYLAERNLKINKENIEKYKLWKELGEKTILPEKINGHWVYSNISFDDVFGSTAKYEIEHILPKSETGDDSYMNKTLCLSGVNGAKGQRTPYEYYQKVMTKEELEIWIKHVYSIFNDKHDSKNKRSKILLTRKEMLSKISNNASLNDTRYIARVLKDYLEQIVVDKVETTKGGYSAMLRKELDLNKLLGDSNKKSRIDYRHHMVDGLVIALSTKSTIDALNKIRKLPSYEVYGNKKSKRYNDLHSKINSRFKIRQDFESHFENTLTSHEVENKASGGFDEETIYSLMREKMVKSECGEFEYPILSKIDLSKFEDIAELDSKEYDDCVFVTSKKASSELVGKKISEIINGKYALPKELFEVLIKMPKDKELEQIPILKSGNVLKKVKEIYSKFKSTNCHFIKNKENEVIGFKKLGSNFCVVDYDTDTPRVVSLFEYLNNKEINKKDVLFKGTIMRDDSGNHWKIYKFSGSDICLHPINKVNIESRYEKKYKTSKNSLKKSFNSLKKADFVRII